MGLTSVEGERYWIRQQIWHKFHISLETNMEGKHWACFIGYKEKGIFCNGSRRNPISFIPLLLCALHVVSL